MHITSIEFIEHAGTNREWRLHPVHLQDLNLIVGKNAVGKSRLLNIISALAKTICGRTKLGLGSSDWWVTLDDQGVPIKYELKQNGSLIVHEQFTRGTGQPQLTRNEKGEGHIRAELANEVLEFGVPLNVPAVLAKRDAKQHPFLESFITWGQSLQLFRFGKGMGKSRVSVIDEEVKGLPTHDDTDAIVETFLGARNEYKDPFDAAIIADMKDLGYELDAVEVATPVSAKLSGIGRKAVGMMVRETGLLAPIDFNAMSDGMFRALALVIHLNVQKFSGRSETILVDDIGEGLDFDRSRSLIQLAFAKLQDTKSQLILTTNDRFVMNAVPLQHWIVLRRKGADVNALDRVNAKERFERFENTGLSNFDLFATDYLDSNDE